MRTMQVPRVVVASLLLGGSLAAWCQHLNPEGDPPASSHLAPNAPIPVQQVISKLQERNAQRAAALDEFSSRRFYSMQYRGLLGNYDAQMVVDATYKAPNIKEFHVVSESGSKFIIDHVFDRLMESEQEFIDEANRQHTALTTANYDFTFAGYETTPEGAQYILNLLPKTKNQFLYRGKIWVDAKDFAVVRIEGEPAKNPSMWIKKTQIDHKYVKVNDFWLPAENHTESMLRFGGRATLSILYKDYKITKAAPRHELDNARANSK